MYLRELVNVYLRDDDSLSCSRSWTGIPCNGNWTETPCNRIGLGQTSLCHGRWIGTYSPAIVNCPLSIKGRIWQFGVRERLKQSLKTQEGPKAKAPKTWTGDKASGDIVYFIYILHPLLFSFSVPSSLSRSDILRSWEVTP